MLDADIRGFFDNLSHEWLMKFIEHRIADRTDAAPDPEMAEGGSVGGRAVVGDGGRDAARGSGLAAAGKHLPALCLRSVGQAVAQDSQRDGRCDRRPLRG